MKIRFTQRHVVPLGEGKTMAYHAGDVHSFDGAVAETYARKYIRRGWAEEVVEGAGAPVLPAAGRPARTTPVDQVLSPFDHDGDGRVGGSSPAAPTDGVKSPAELLAALEADPPMNFFTFKAEAKKLLGDETPANKDGIVAALQAMLPPPAAAEGDEGAETPAVE